MASSDNETLSADEAMALTRANNYLALSLYKRLAKEKQNVFFSPFSVSTALAMLFCGAREETALEMRRVFGYDHAGILDKSVVSCFRRALERVENNDDGNLMSYANSLLIQKGFPLRQEYKSAMKDSFQALLMEVDFLKESTKVVNQINQMVKEKTKGMVTNFLKFLNPATVLVILNAIYFKGSWLHQFDKNATSLEYFYNHGKKKNAKKVPMMQMKERFPFVAKETFQALQLPYKGKNTAMLILLPRSRDGLGDLEVSLDPAFIHGLKAEMRETQVQVALPKFRLEYSKYLEEDFKALGMKRAFEPGAHLDGLSDCGGLAVSQIVHKAVLEVNEEGSEASAATAVIVVRCLPPQFIVDHPFVLAIYDTTSGLIFFMGRVEEL